MVGVPLLWCTVHPLCLSPPQVEENQADKSYSGMNSPQESLDHFAPLSLFNYTFTAMDSRPASSQALDRSLKFEVSLPSGRSETVVVSWSGSIADLNRAAQQSLRQPFLRLAAPDGRLLDSKDSLQLSGLQDGDSLTAVALQPKIAATWAAFAFWCVRGDRIVTWGHPLRGGDSSRIQDQKISSGMFSRSVPHKALLLPFWQMEAW